MVMLGLNLAWPASASNSDYGRNSLLLDHSLLHDMEERENKILWRGKARGFIPALESTTIRRAEEEAAIDPTISSDTLWISRIPILTLR